MTETDVIVVGSGAAGMMAALRAKASGLDVIIVEKARQYGGTTATSGGIFWIPNHGVGGLQDSPDRAMEYLHYITSGEAPEARLRAFVDHGPRMVRFLDTLGIPVENLRATHDYYVEAPGNLPGRSLAVPEYDVAGLGDELLRMRAPNAMRMLFNRYLLDRPQAYKLSGRTRGWQWTAARMILKYWASLGRRLRSRRDYRATGGDALIGHFRRELIRCDIPLILDCALTRLLFEGGRVGGIVARDKGSPRTIRARKAVILAAGGYEQNQQLRDAHLPIGTDRRWSLAPDGANTGDALLAAQAIGASGAFLGYMWWMPVIRLPSQSYPNIEIAHSMAFEQRHPNSIMVNRQGDRFCNENISYDRFGLEMVRDQLRSDANVPCWMIFDATYRARYSCGGLMPTIVTPDWRVPPDWWDMYLFRGSTIAELASKIGLPTDRVIATIARFNGFAANGVDEDFGRGGNAFDLARADRRVRPNGCLGAIDKAPFYAVRIDLGDIGTKGGLKCNEHAQVLDAHDHPIAGLYAAGNCAASPFANVYPGAGGTIGPALTFGFIAAEHAASYQRSTIREETFI